MCSLRLTLSCAPSRQGPIKEAGSLPPTPDIGWTLTCAGTRTSWLDRADLPAKLGLYNFQMLAVGNHPITGRIFKFSSHSEAGACPRPPPLPGPGRTNRTLEEGRFWWRRSVEHTKSRGPVGVAGDGGDALGGCRSAVGGVMSPNPALKIYFRNHPPDTLPLPPALTERLNLALGRAATDLSHLRFHPQDHCPLRGRPPQGLPRLSALPTPLRLCKGLFIHCLSHPAEAHQGGTLETWAMKACELVSGNTVLIHPLVALGGCLGNLFLITSPVPAPPH